VTDPGRGFLVQSSPGAGVATITTTSAHGLIAGNYVQIFNPGDATYAAPLNGAVVEVLEVTSPEQFTVSASYGGKTMASGDYSSGFSGQIWQVHSMFQSLDQSWLQWLNQFLNGYFTVVASYAQGGTASSVGVQLVPKIQAGPKADYAFIQYCTNDENSTSPDVGGCLSNIKAIVAAVEALGMVPVVCTPPAIGDPAASPGDPASATKAAALLAVKQAEEQMAQADAQILLIDTYSRTVTPGDPLGHYLPDYAPVDGIHLSTYGSVKLAQSVATELKKVFPLADLLPASAADDGTLSPGGFDIIQNGLMTGSDGVINSSADNTVNGTIPTGWTFTALGGTQATPLAFHVAGNGSHSAMPGYTLDIGVDAAGAGQGFQIGTNAPGENDFGPRMRVGSWYRCGFELLADSDLHGLNLSGQIMLQLADGSRPSVGFMGSSAAQYDNGTPLAAGDTLEYLSQPFVVPQAVTAAYFFIDGYFSAAAGGDSISLGRAFCRVLENPYQ